MKNLFDDITILLNDHDLTYKWLIMRLKEIGFDTDKVSMSKWVHGVQCSGKAQEAHDLSLKIINLYTKTFAEKVGELA